MRRSGYALGLCSIAVGVLCLTLSGHPAQAELYVAGQIGYTSPNDLSSVQGTGPISGVSFSDLKLDNSIVYGAKVGYYLPSVNWLGIETEMFNTTPDVKQQPITVLGVTVPAPGFNLNVFTWAINAIVRYPGKQFQPYAGVGLGVFFAEAKFQGTSDKDVAPGLNALAGVRYFATDHIALFAEYKYNRAAFELPDAIGIKADYSANHFVGGVSYHF
jgi:opacity protein-like surface antigen